MILFAFGFACGLIAYEGTMRVLWYRANKRRQAAEARFNEQLSKSLSGAVASLLGPAVMHVPPDSQAQERKPN